MANLQQIPFTKIIDALLNLNTNFPPIYLHRFSDLPEEDVKQLASVWDKINPQRKAALMEDLEVLYDSDTVVKFDEVSMLAIKDPHPSVRASAIRLLSEEPKESQVNLFMRLAEKDPDPVVRSEAIGSLGQYIFLGELDKIRAEVKHEVEEKLFKILGSKEEAMLRRRALEALGYSTHPDAAPAIQRAYVQKEIPWVASAIYAMGRSMDSRWEKIILENISSPDPEISFEAVRAAGKMELQSARARLMKMLNDYEELDEETRAAIVWSLSEIGGEGVRKKLEGLLSQLEDEDEVDWVEEALENLEFTEDFKLEGMFDLDVLKQKGLNTIIDLEEEEADSYDPSKLQLDDLDDMEDQNYIESGYYGSDAMEDDEYGIADEDEEDGDRE